MLTTVLYILFSHFGDYIKNIFKFHFEQLLFRITIAF